MTDILSFINDKYQGKYSFLRLGNVRISVEEKKANITFLVPEDIYDYHLKSDDFNRIKEAVKEAVGGAYSVYCRLEKIVLTEESVISALAEYLTKFFPMVAANSDFSRCKVSFGEQISLSLAVVSNLRDYMDRIDFEKKVKEFIFAKYAARADIRYEAIQENDHKINEQRSESGRYGKSVNVTDKTIVIGKLSDLHSPAVHISTLKGEGEEAVCCGKISYLAFKTRDESKRDTYKKFFKHYYTFSISDTTGFLNIFINTDDEYPLLQNGAEVICKGRVNARDDSSNLSMYAKSVAICKIPFATIEEQTKPLDPPLNYSILTPRDYHEEVYDQMGFDFFSDRKKKIENTSANGIALVVRSLKTERAFVPYEIAMCRVESGKISQYVHTYLKVAFTDESDRAIFANQKGYSSPRLSTVIPDLLKFSAGALIVGTNPSAALDLLNVTAKPLRYLFSNDVHVIQMPTSKNENGKNGDALEEAVAIARAFINN